MMSASRSIPPNYQSLEMNYCFGRLDFARHLPNLATPYHVIDRLVATRQDPIGQKSAKSSWLWSTEMGGLIRGCARKCAPYPAPKVAAIYRNSPRPVWPQFPPLESVDGKRSPLRFPMQVGSM